MLQFGNGFKVTNPRKLLEREKEYLNLSSMKVFMIGSTYMWIWVAMKLESKHILPVTVSKERTMLIAERFILSLTNRYGSHPVSTDGGTWYPQACRFLNVDHHLHSPFEKRLIERTIQYVKDRTESFDDYFPCKRKKCKLNYVKKCLNLFAYLYNKGKSAYVNRA